MQMTCEVGLVISYEYIKSSPLLSFFIFLHRHRHSHLLILFSSDTSSSNTFLSNTTLVSEKLQPTLAVIHLHLK